MSPFSTSILAAAILLVGTLLCGLLPYKLLGVLTSNAHTRQRTDGIVKAISSFAGGVFFAACFLHLLPETTEHLADAFEHKAIDVGHYPLGFLLTGVGFFMIVFVETVLHYFHERNHSDEHTPLTKRSDSLSTPNATQQLEITSDRLPRREHNHRALPLLIALVFHSIFEGFAIGFQQSTTQIWELFIAVALHKFVIAFSLGLHVAVESRQMVKIVLFNLLFAIASPLGTVTAALLSSNVQNSPDLMLTDGILSSLCGGTFVYVTFIEIIAKDVIVNDRPKRTLLHILLCFIGFSLIASLNLLHDG